MVEATNGYIYCDTETALIQSIEALNGCDTLVVDCEGNNLGQRGGKLSLITVRSLTSPSAYIFDAVALSPTNLRPVFDLLASPSIVKVLYDGRMDFSCLHHDLGVGMTNVLDMQLADVRSRQVKGEDDHKRLDRLYSFIPCHQVEADEACYRNIQRLSGLINCAIEHGVTQSQKISVDHSLWLLRPLSVNALKYAVGDVNLIGLLYQHFEEHGYIDSDLPSQSLRYISMWKASQRSVSDMYSNHCLLPLDILQAPPSGAVLKNCGGCGRSLSRDAFSKNMWGRSQDVNCWVCRAIYVLPRRMKRRIYDAEDSDDDDYDVDCYDYFDLDEDRYDYYDSDDGYW